jgi:hypothetical protein
MAIPAEANKILGALMVDGLISLQERQTPHGPEQVWRIVPGVKPALEELLYAESSSDSSHT